MEQAEHYRNWTYCVIDLIASRLASIFPNLAYVSDTPIKGVTEKWAERSIGRYGGTSHLGTEDSYGGGRAMELRHEGNFSNGYSTRYTELEKAYRAPDFPGCGVGFSDGGHSWLTMGAYRSKALSVVKPHEELEPLESDHPLRRLIENPNPWDTYFDLEYEKWMFGELTGSWYEWLVPNDWGVPCERWCLPSHWVWPKTGGGKYIDPHHPDASRLIWYYEVRPWGGTYGAAGILKIPPDEIVCNRWKSPINKIDGYARLAAVAQWIDVEESISKSRWAQMMNVARPELVIKLGPGYEDPDDDKVQRYLAKVAAEHQGEYNYGKPWVIPVGSELVPIGFNPSEMAYSQSGEQIRDMILAAWHVPKSALGISEEMTYGSLLAAAANLCANALNVRLIMAGQTGTKHLASRWDEEVPAWSQGTDIYRDSNTGLHTHGGKSGVRRVRLWFDDCVPADPTQVNADIQADAAQYAITPNEIRALRGRKPYRYGGDDPLVQGPGGIQPLPMNSRENLDELAQLVGEYNQTAGGQQGGQEQGGGPGGVIGTGATAPPGLPGPTEGGNTAAGADNNRAEGGQEVELAPGIENPNQPPSKGVADYEIKVRWLERDQVMVAVVTDKRTGKEVVALPGEDEDEARYEAQLWIRRHAKGVYSPPSKALKRWDEWFAAVGGETLKAWRAVKDTFPGDPQRQLGWAKLMETNRLTAAVQTKELVAQASLNRLAGLFLKSRATNNGNGDYR